MRYITVVNIPAINANKIIMDRGKSYVSRYKSIDVESTLLVEITTAIIIRKTVNNRKNNLPIDIF
tara:strand:- start:884 stop:1078 length:195 start_codon:yes stop_codon:yes gene_type:complete